MNEVQITNEDFQRYIRTSLQWLSGSLVTYGLVDKDAGWVPIAVGAATTILSALWMLYGNRIQAKINEVAKLNVVTSVKVNSVAVAVASPANVTATKTATK